DVAALADAYAVGTAKASAVAAAFELGRRLALEGTELRPVITSPHDIARLLAGEMELLEQEELRLLALDAKHHVLAQSTLYRGTVTAAPGRVAELFREAVRRNAVAIAIAHNHPSGDPAPSEDDVEFTRAVVAAGVLLEISVLDHLVVGHGRWLSLRERGLGFEEAPGEG
ncbi:MAG: DNA repair protein RadC, partial [Chloroflexi bacterium]|nr:DNA repair protein RadC [Chloroflexota bacterium]